jgi:hypothetical protein
MAVPAEPKKADATLRQQRNSQCCHINEEQLSENQYDILKTNMLQTLRK